MQVTYYSGDIDHAVKYQSLIEVNARKESKLLRAEHPKYLVSIPYRG